MADSQFVAKVMFALTLAYPNANISKETIAVYARDLSDLPEDVLDLACTQCRSTLKFFPTIAEIREIAGRLQSGADSFPPAAEAWGSAIKIIAALGYYQSPEFPNPVTARVMAAMGWRRVAEGENPSADRARFIELYNEYVKRGAQQAQLPPALRQGSPALAAVQNLAKQLKGATK